jgi:hypothetical protein
MALVPELGSVDTRYWKVTDTDARADGRFDINLKQVQDYTGAPFQIQPAPRRTITRAADVPLGTIVKVVDTTQVDRVFTVNPAS